MTWITERIALGGAIWSDSNMQEVARSGVTHILDMQIEFDDTELARPYGVEVLWNGTDDDFQPKPPELLGKGVAFGLAALQEDGCKLYIHCAAGVHRAAMMTLALLAAMGWELEDAMEMIQRRRPVVDFADVYVGSVENYLRRLELSRGAAEASDSGNGKKGSWAKSRNTV
ncbi:MAG TPA: dual specificity protein phosphatase [Terriglobales bacterium]|nr:dual specificity protein phosphatase [Terriglobales bacterium]